MRVARTYAVAGRLDAGRLEGAFTLLELMVVIAIIGIVAALSLPVITKFSKPNAVGAATSQIRDDLQQARALALSQRAPVFMVFIPTNAWNFLPSSYTTQQATIRTNLLLGQYRGYALFQERSVGDQPGNPKPRYLKEWQFLPDEIFIPAAAFDNALYNTNTFWTRDFPFPTVDSPLTTLHYIAFNSQGQLIYFDSLDRETPVGTDAIVPVTEGTIFLPRNADDTFQLAPPDVLEAPPNRSQDTNQITRVRINWVTGKGRIESPQLQ